MSTTTLSEILSESRSRRLKACTHAVHDRLDRSIMGADAFATIAGYARFIGIQFLFHRDVDALCGDAGLQALLPDLADRRRGMLLAQDLADLGVPEPSPVSPAAFPAESQADIATALGWLYVAEGSRVGGALLRKEAAKLGLSDTFGARHLAPAAQEGPAAYWRLFTGTLDAVVLDAEADARVVAGAHAAFAAVQSYVDARLR